MRLDRVILCAVPATKSHVLEHDSGNDRYGARRARSAAGHSRDRPSLCMGDGILGLSMNGRLIKEGGDIELQDVSGVASE